MKTHTPPKIKAFYGSAKKRKGAAYWIVNYLMRNENKPATIRTFQSIANPYKSYTHQTITSVVSVLADEGIIVPVGITKDGHYTLWRLSENEEEMKKFAHERKLRAYYNAKRRMERLEKELREKCNIII